jgi:hypothetical protein
MTSGRAFRRKLVIPALVLLIASAALFAGSRILSDLGIRFWNSTALLEDLIDKAAIDTSAADPISVIGPDGTMPEIASQYIPMQSGHQEAIAALKRACRALGLDPPRADQLGSMPETICSGRYHGARVRVGAIVAPGDPAHLSVTTYALHF